MAEVMLVKKVNWCRQKLKYVLVKYLSENVCVCWWKYQHTISYIFTNIVFHQHTSQQHQRALGV